MVDIAFNTYYRYEDLTAILQAFAEEYPKLVKLESIGKSYEGRDIWLATVTNFESGAAEDKPALWVDGNIHATEVSPSSACLYLIHKITQAYGENADITRCMDTRAFYVCPRVNPDGAELALADKPRMIRSSTRPYPYDEEALEGLVMEDLDGDGRVLQMRIEDPNGHWKAHPEEPRLLVRRDPIETGGTYYRIIPEGQIENYDGVTISFKRNKEGLDMNRNFPAEWKQDYEQSGAGPYPTSESETHAIVEFIVRHRNITGALTYHTYGGILLRPYSFQPDDKMPAEDLWTFEKIGNKGTEITGYPNVSVFHDFKYHPQDIIYGGFDDWAFHHLGMYAWTIEIWSPQQQAGIKDYKFIDWYREHEVADDLKLLKWSDDMLEGQGYVDWYEYEHPQLGKVELGGWDYMYAWRNPPPQYLEKEIAPLTDWMIWHLLISPRLETYAFEMTPLGADNYHIRLVVHNTGWLPSYITKTAVKKKIVRGVVAEIELPEGATLKSGKSREMLGELEGRAYAHSAPVGLSMDSTSERAKVEWIVHAPDGGGLTITAQHDRAGKITETIELRG